MPTQLGVNDTGTWRLPVYLSVNDAGVWQHVVQLWANNAGVWEIVTPYYDEVQVGDLNSSRYGYGSGIVTPPDAGGALAFGAGLNLNSTYGLTGLGLLIALWTGNPGAGARDLILTCGQGASNQSAFSSITVFTSGGTVVTYTSAAATYSFVGGVNIGTWQWGAGAAPVYTVGDIGNRRWFCILP